MGKMDMERAKRAAAKGDSDDTETEGVERK